MCIAIYLRDMRLYNAPYPVICWLIPRVMTTYANQIAPSEAYL